MNASSLWRAFLKGFQHAGITIPIERFKVDSGLRIADWQKINYTGLDTEYHGQLNHEVLFNTSDQMPDDSLFEYVPKGSFFDRYEVYLSSIKENPNHPDPMIMSMKKRVGSHRMKDEYGNEFPQYSITPDLNQFLQNSLLHNGKPPVLSFSVHIDPNDESLNKRSADDTPLPDFIKVKHKHEEKNMFGALKGNLSHQKISNFKSKPAGNTSAAYDIKFEAQNVQLFNVSKGRWYHDGSLAYSAHLSKSSILSNKPIFGVGGWLNACTSGILVAYKRKVEISSDQMDLMKLHNPQMMADPNASIDIGGYTFQGGPNTQFEQSQNVYKYEDNTNAPYILGFMIDRLSH